MAEKGLSPEQWERLKQSIKNSVKIETPDFNPDDIPTPPYSPIATPPLPVETVHAPSIEAPSPEEDQDRRPEPEIPNLPVPEEAPVHDEAITSTSDRPTKDKKDDASVSMGIRECYAELGNITDQLKEIEKQHEQAQDRKNKNRMRMQAYRQRQKARYEELKNGGIRTSEDLMEYLRLQAAKERAMKSTQDYQRRCRLEHYLAQRAHLNQHFVNLSEFQNITEDISGDQSGLNMPDPLDIEEELSRYVVK